jgi:serine/threonine protein kinase
MGQKISAPQDGPGSPEAAERLKLAQSSRRNFWIRHSKGNIWKSFACGEDLNDGLGHVNVCALRPSMKRAGNRRYACKWVARSARRDIIDDLIKEANILRALDHPNIVHLRETWEDRHNFYLVLQLLSGPSLFRDLQSQPKQRYPESRAKSLFRMIASAIAYIHSHGICHCDVKLDNIIFEGAVGGTGAGRLVLIDFGLARQIGSVDGLIGDAKRCIEWGRDASDATGSEKSGKSVEASPGKHVPLTGQLEYLSPEIFSVAKLGCSRSDSAKSPREVSKRKLRKWNSSPAFCSVVDGKGPAGDVWALGVTLCAMLSGAFPFSSRRDVDRLGLEPTKDHRLARMVRNADPELSPYLQTKISPAGKELLMTLLEKNPCKRVTAREILLHRWLEGGNRQEETVRRADYNCRRDKAADLKAALEALASLETVQNPAAEPRPRQILCEAVAFDSSFDTWAERIEGEGASMHELHIIAERAFSWLSNPAKQCSRNVRLREKSKETEETTEIIPRAGHNCYVGAEGVRECIVHGALKTKIWPTSDSTVSAIPYNLICAALVAGNQSKYTRTTSHTFHHMEKVRAGILRNGNIYPYSAEDVTQMKKLLFDHEHKNRNDANLERKHLVSIKHE